MKRFLLIGCFAFLATLPFGCSQNDPLHDPEPEPEPVKLNRDTVEYALGFAQYVAEAYRFSGKDSVDIIKENSLIERSRDAVSLQFFYSNGYINFWSLSPTANTAFPGGALTFSMGIKVNLPTGMRTEWDEEKGTMKVYTADISNYFPMIIPGKTGYLESSTFKYYRTLQEAQAAKVKPRMVFVYEDEDPKLGKVTYRVTLKPLYEYYREPYQQSTASFVVF